MDIPISTAGYNMILVVLVIVLQVLDVLLTRTIIIDQGGREVWPTTKWLMGRIGLMPALIVSKAALAAVLFGSWWLYGESNAMTAVYLVAVVAYVAVVARNYNQMR